MEECKPTYLNLSQNSPYLFKDNTKIRYSLPSKTYVCLTVFNAKGKVIKKLVNEIQDAGRYEINFNRIFFPSGEYFCQLKVDDPTGELGKEYQQIMKIAVLN